MVGLVGSACIIKERMQRNNTDPLGCAAAPFFSGKGRLIRTSAAASTKFILFLMVLKYTYRPVLWGRDHKGPHMPLYIIQITVETVLKGWMSSTPVPFGGSEAHVSLTLYMEKQNKYAIANVLFI